MKLCWSYTCVTIHVLNIMHEPQLAENILSLMEVGHTLVEASDTSSMQVGLVHENS